jgi:hypothetical protein
VTLSWLAARLQAFVDLNPEFEGPVDRLATWLAVRPYARTRSEISRGAGARAAMRYQGSRREQHAEGDERQAEGGGAERIPADPNGQLGVAGAPQRCLPEPGHPPGLRHPSLR